MGRHVGRQHAADEASVAQDVLFELTRNRVAALLSAGWRITPGEPTGAPLYDELVAHGVAAAVARALPGAAPAARMVPMWAGDPPYEDDADAAPHTGPIGVPSSGRLGTPTTGPAARPWPAWARAPFPSPATGNSVDTGGAA